MICFVHKFNFSSPHANFVGQYAGIYCSLHTVLPGLSPGAIAGIVVGNVIGLVLIVGFFFIVFFCGILVAGTRTCFTKCVWI